MKPRGKLQNYVGIEIEFISSASVDECRKLLKRMKMNTWCEAVSDSSIEDDDGNELPNYIGDIENYYADEEYLFGVELRVLSTEKSLPIKLKKVKRFLSKVDASVNESCGLHVHLDMRNRNIEKCTTRMLFGYQVQMRKMVPSWRRASHYCSPLAFSELYPNKKFTTSIMARYDINVRAYNKHKTLEVRLHEGTIDMEEISSWVKYLVCIVDNKGGMIDKGYVNKRIEMCS